MLHPRTKNKAVFTFNFRIIFIGKFIGKQSIYQFDEHVRHMAATNYITQA
jgi:hypothetical protein